MTVMKKTSCLPLLLLLRLSLFVPWTKLCASSGGPCFVRQCQTFIKDAKLYAPCSGRVFDLYTADESGMIGKMHTLPWTCASTVPLPL
jgi:hypothetical protein